MAIVSCTLLGDREIVQCNVDDDCKGSKATAGVGHPPRCVDHLCARINEAADAGDALPPNDTGTDAPVILCKTTKGCPQNKGETICVDGECKPFGNTEVCKRVISPNAAHTDDGALLIGVYAYAAANGSATKIVQNALETINASPVKKPKIAALVCDKLGIRANDSAPKVLAYLDSLKIPIVIGQFESTELNLTSNVAVWSTLGTFQASAVDAGSQDASDLRPRFLTDELQSLAPAYPAALTQAIANADALAGTALGASLKIAVVSTSAPETTALADKIAAGYTGPGTVVVDKTLPSLFDTSGKESEVDTIVGAIRAQSPRPHVIALVGGDEVLTFITRLEQTWGPVGSPQRPVYVVTSRMKFNATKLNVFVPEAMRPRIIGVDFEGDPTRLQQIAIPTVGAQEHLAWGILHDSIYAAAFAAIRVNFERKNNELPFTAAELTRGLDAVFQSDGMSVTGAAPLTDGVFTHVNNGGTIKFAGVSGAWAFPGPDRRFRRTEQSYFCYPSNQSVLQTYLDGGAFAAGLCATPP